MTLYFLGGLAGLPWYAGHAHGFAPATTGYLLGFILAAVVAGELSRRGFSRAWWRAIPVMLASEMVIFALGVSWLKVDLGVTWSTAIAYGLTPFWVGEIVKATLAGLVMPASWRAVWRLTR
jgi:biotin transport system substrate-specific component